MVIVNKKRGREVDYSFNALESRTLKVSVLTVLLILLIIPLTSAINIEMKTEFDKGETLIASFSGNFLESVSDENVFFYRDHVRIPLVFEIEKINNEYNLYALLIGKGAGNYSVVLEDVRYMKAAEISEDDITKNFTITENTTDFSVNPGFVNTFTDFSLEVQNLQEDTITIQITTSEGIISDNSTTLVSGEVKDIDFELNNPGSSETIELSSEDTNYPIPIIIHSNATTERKERDFSFEPDLAEVIMATDSDEKIIIYLKSTGTEAVEDITFSISEELEDYITISPETIRELDEGSIERFEIDIISDSEEEIIQGEIIAQAENLSISFMLILDFREDYNGSTGEEVVLTTCEEGFGGTMCETDQKCGEDGEGDVIHANEGICCLDTCRDIKKGSGGKILGWGIIILIILFVFWFFKAKFRRVGRNRGMNMFGRGRRGRRY